MTLGQRVRRLLRSRILRFGIVGAAGFVVDEAILAFMHYAVGMDPYSARATSIFCAMTFTWWGNRNLTFAMQAATGGARTIAAEWARFVLANALGAVANYAAFSSLVGMAPPPLNNPLFAAAIGVGVGLVFNFTLSKRFVFRAQG